MSSAGETRKMKPDGGWRVYLLVVVVLFYAIGFVFNVMLAYQFVYWRVEQDEFRSANITANNRSHTSNCATGNHDNTSRMITARAQEISSNWQLYLNVAGGIPSAVACVVLGSLSDRLGRRFLFVLPSIGALVRSVVYAAVSYWRLPLFYLIIVHVLEGLTGSNVTILLASFAAVSDSTNRGNRRSLLITVMECIASFAIGVANISLGFMIKSLGFAIPNIPAIVLLASAIFITIFFLPETMKKQTKERISFCKSVYRVFQFYVSNTNDNLRCIYIICISAFAFACVAFVGITGVETLYVMNEPLCWGSVKIGYYGTIKAVCQAIGAVIVVRLLQFCLSDISIGLVAGLCKASSFVLEGFATADFYMYTVAVIGMSGIGLLAMMRSIMSKLTDEHHLGALFASIACVEAIATIASSSGFVALYKETLKFYDGTVFFLVALLVVFSMGFYVLLYFKLRSREKKLLLVVHDIQVNDKGPILENTISYNGS